MAVFNKIEKGRYCDRDKRFLIENKDKEWIVTDTETGEIIKCATYSDAKMEVDNILSESSPTLFFKSWDDLEKKGYCVIEYKKKNAITSKIEERLKEKGETYNDYALLLGVSKQYFSEMVKDPSLFTLEYALKMSELLGCTVNELFDLRDDSWIIPYPISQTRHDTYYVDTRTLEVMNSIQKNTAKLYYWMDGSPETTLTSEEYKKMIKEMQRKYTPLQYREKKAELDKQWHPSFARLYKDISANIKKAKDMEENK